MKAYIILENNKDTQGLINHLSEKDDGTITVVDEYLENVLSKRGEATYVNGTYVDSVKDMDLPFVYYHYIEPIHRRDARKWRRSLSSER
ncbi:MAG TPA: hypothetical protein K8V56_11045 [Sporosarcina psychrophila]|uniref:Uncharacterized protein n=1 Tax=Sporosarcina psychrophila TaxID=1476 RepID=A0A921KDN9_SPOPS|nr:hypothetical protein [Sporosarcina psychrophila]